MFKTACPLLGSAGIGLPSRSVGGGGRGADRLQRQAADEVATIGSGVGVAGRTCRWGEDAVGMVRLEQNNWAIESVGTASVLGNGSGWESAVEG